MNKYAALVLLLPMGMIYAKDLPAPQPSQTMLAGLPEDGLSNEFPEGLVAGSPSVTRFKAEPGWKPDGVIKARKRDGEGMLSKGDSVNVEMNANADVHPGDRYLVLRKSVPTDTDDDQQAVYLAYIGVLEIRTRASEKVYGALILRSIDAVQANDLVKRVKREE